ncbi:Esterase PHB depolymerase [Lachnospiraceae bacterium NK3A20]|nr:Esterase PHB depolymerase [Lachnospiraceae bacterium NK3A20]
MQNKLELRAGTPNDATREYLPEEIYGSDMVINEAGNNSIPWNPRLKKCQEALVTEGELDTWYEYVPESYDGTKDVPLVVGLHGGLMTGWGHSTYTSWTMVADREGLICLFPDAEQGRVWAVEKIFDDDDGGDRIFTPKVPKDKKDNHDLNMLLALIRRMQEKYRIDPGRIFMQGMSMGNLMTHMFTRYYGNILAGAAGSACSSYANVLFDENYNIMNEAGPVAVWQTRPENNGVPSFADKADESRVNRYNRWYWLKINGCDTIPQIHIDGEDNYAFYKGKYADQVFLDVKNRDHGQTLDEAFLYWDYFFSGLRKNPDGTITQSKTNLPRQGDAYAAAFAEGADLVWWKNKPQKLSTAPVLWQKLKYHGLNGGQLVRGEYLCVPVSFLAEMASGEYIPSEDTLTAEIKLPDGRRLQFARGSIGCLIGDKLRSMSCEALHRNGELLVSAEWFAEAVLNLTVTKCNGVVYITDHFAVLSSFMADLIRDLLTEQADPASYDRLMREDVKRIERS